MEIDRAFCRRAEVARLARRLLQETVSACDSGEATLWTLSQDRLSLEGAVNVGARPEVVETLAVPVKGSVIGSVALREELTSISAEDPHHPLVDEKTGVATQAMAAAPVRVEGRLVGVLSTINPRTRATFARADLEALAFKAYLLGLVLHDLAR